ncbi:MAG: 1-acyl-sn-glycerol-3-phosphate acyltransferase [Bacteroidales bacterium]|nr:1-acyl-sn-glycerol-3-phosphate acyltransferase [Bacteroidales bacterium]
MRTFFALPVFRFFYRNIHVSGKRTKSDRGAVIFAPNHQNALMDAICILCTENRQPVFVARADIFNKPYIVRLLHFLHILPIYRKRDGVNVMDNNQETFDILLKILLHGRAVGIMPEGTHNKIKRLQMLQKGIFRIALKAQESYGRQRGIRIVPVGLEYSDTRKFRSDVIIHYGEALEMADYYDLYAENPAKAFRTLQRVLSERMKSGMIHIENEAFYQEIEWARRVWEQPVVRQLGLKCDGAGRLKAQQVIVAALEKLARDDQDAMRQLCARIGEYARILEKYRLRDWVTAHQPYSLPLLLMRTLLLFAGIPFWLAGILFNYLPYKLSEKASAKVKDPQFISSVRFVAGVVLFPLYYLIVAVLSVIFIPCAWGKIAIIVLLLPSGLFAFEFYLSVKKLFARYRFRRHGKDAEICKAVELRKNILEVLKKITTANP